MRRVHTGVLITVGLLVLAAGALVVQRLRQGAERSAEIAQLLDDVATEVKKDSPDGSELSRLKLRIEKLPEHATDRALILALTRIEIARGRDNAGWELIAPYAAVGDASLAELRIGADLLLRLHARSGDRTQARRARELARRAYALSHDPGDLLVAWQAAHRIAATADAQETFELLRTEHKDSREERLCDLIESPPPDDQFGARVHELEAEFKDEPIELGLARAVLLLKQGDQVAARTLLDELASRASALLDVRHLCAIAYHMAAASPDLPEAERQSARTRRDAHLHFCLEHGPDDPRRAQWQQLLGG